MILYPEFKNNLKKSIGLAAPSTKELILSSINSDSQKFPEILAKYYWGGTRDYNVALIIIAFYAYCINNNSDTILKAFANMIKQNGTNHHKLLENLKKGDGTGIRNCMGKNFDDTLDYVLRKALPCDASNKEIDNKNKKARNKVIKNFKDYAKKIKPWIINKKSVEDLVGSLLNTAPKQSETPPLQETSDKSAQDLKNNLLKYETSSGSQKPEETIETLFNFIVYCFNNQHKFAKTAIENFTRISLNPQGIVLGMILRDGEKIKNSFGVMPKGALDLVLKNFGITDSNKTAKIIENFINALGKINDKVTMSEAFFQKIRNLATRYGVKIPESKNTDNTCKLDPDVEKLLDKLCKQLTDTIESNTTGETIKRKNYEIFQSMRDLVKKLQGEKEECKNECLKRIKNATTNKPMGAQNTCYWDNIFKESLKKGDGELYYPCEGFEFGLITEKSGTISDTKFHHILEQIPLGSKVTFMLNDECADKFGRAVKAGMYVAMRALEFNKPFKETLTSVNKPLLTRHIGGWAICKQVHRIAILKIER